MSDRQYCDSVPVILFITATSMVLGAFCIAIAISLNIRKETLVNRKNGLVNQTYVRAIDCKLSVPANQRNTQWIKGCYDKAEKATGAKVTRYGDGK